MNKQELYPLLIGKDSLLFFIMLHLICMNFTKRKEI